MTGPTPLTELATILADEGGLLADVLADTVGDGLDRAEHGATAARGPRAAGRESDYALLVEAIREGYLLHYGEPRVLATEDADLALLAGDRLYALGLERLAALGDLEAVEILAGVISRGAQVNAEGRSLDADRVWADGAHAVGHGREKGH